MPELPEVETTKRGIQPHVTKKIVKDVVIRQANLRWPVTRGLKQKLKQQKILALQRRAKYLLFKTNTGHLIIHLGMSGSLRILPKDSAAEKHDHVEHYGREGKFPFPLTRVDGENDN